MIDFFKRHMQEAGAEGAASGGAEGQGAEGQGAEDNNENGGKGNDEDQGQEGEEGGQEGSEEVEYDLSIPDEFKGAVDDSVLDQFKDMAKELGLSNEAAQKLVDFEVSRQSQILEAYNNRLTEWADIVKNDPEVGGADFDKKIAKAHQAFEALANDDLKKLMDPYHPTENPTGLGLGNHPEIVRLFYRLGVNMGEDTLKLANAEGAPAKLDRVEALYGNPQTD